MKRYDAVVIGGGFAGVTAARDLTEQGNTVLLVEARDRLGGRTYSAKFPGTEHDIELGGEYIVRPGQGPGPGNPQIMSEVNRYGIEFETAPWPEGYPTIFAGKRNPGPFPVPLTQIFDLERAALHLLGAASRIRTGQPLDQQGLDDLDIPVSDFLAPLKLPAETYDFVTTVLGFYYLRFAEENSALQALAWLPLWDMSVFQLYAGPADHIPTGELLRRMAADVTEVRLSAPVVSVDQTGDDVVVTIDGGEEVSAAAAVVAIPTTIWNDIDFAPTLNEHKRLTSAERHNSERAVKLVILARNAPNDAVFGDARSTGGGTACHQDRQLENGDTILTMFGMRSLEGDVGFDFDPDDQEAVERVLGRMMPDAELIAYTHHDFKNDPFSKGDPLAFRPGRLTKSHSPMATPEGRLAFATADISHGWLGTIEGAVETGHRAARQTMSHLVRASAAG